MTSAAPILRFSRVSVDAGLQYDTAIADVSFSIFPGELLLVRLDTTAHRTPLADAAQGLLNLDEGAIEFEGKDWTKMSPPVASDMRGRIGRTFDGRGWISNLDVLENIVLSQRYHTSRPQEEITKEASDLARRFGLNAIPPGRPSQTREQDLQRAACVRAFLGRPRLLILENPTLRANPDLLTSLTAAVQEARTEGAGTLWMTTEWAVWNEPALSPTRKFAMSGSKLAADVASC